MKKFLRCDHCGNLVGVINDKNVPISCCGQNMTELVANTTDAANEKHVPAVEIDGDIVKVSVGSVEHPMGEDHYIEWIFVETDKGGQKVALKPGEKPYAEFNLHGAKAIAVYEYCNLHGLWKVEL